MIFLKPFDIFEGLFVYTYIFSFGGGGGGGGGTGGVGGVGGFGGVGGTINSGATGFTGSIDFSTLISGTGGSGGGSLIWENAAAEINNSILAMQIFTRFIIKIFHGMHKKENSINKKPLFIGVYLLLVSVNFFTNQ